MVEPQGHGLRILPRSTGVLCFPCSPNLGYDGSAISQERNNRYNFLQHISRGGAVVRALASHQCVPGSIPRPGVICGLSLLLVREFEGHGLISRRLLRAILVKQRRYIFYLFLSLNHRIHLFQAI